MSAEAMTELGEQFRIESMLAAGMTMDEVAKNMRIVQKTEGLYCFACAHIAGRFDDSTRVLFKNGYIGESGKRIPCFDHQDGHGGPKSPCRNYSGETKKHQCAKHDIAEMFKQQSNVASVTIDTEWVLSSGGAKNKPDVLVYFQDGRIEAHEIQVSNITLDGLKERTANMQSSGVKVVWYLHNPARGGNYRKQELRRYLWSNSIDCYRLEFSEDEEQSFRVPADPPEDDKPQRAKAQASCSRQSNVAVALQEVDFQAPPALAWEERPSQQSVMTNTPPPITSVTTEAVTVLSLAEWFLTVEIDLPKGFQLDANRKLSDPSIFLRRLREEAQDVISGGCPRDRYGAVQKDLLILRNHMEQYDAN